MLNKQTGNMYPFVTHTWNAIRGECPHTCFYCYMKKFPQGKLRLEEKEFHTNLGSGNFIFVGSSTDMWAKEVQDEWIFKTFTYCNDFPDNQYLFQTKNPARFNQIASYYSPEWFAVTPEWFAVTIETNRDYSGYSISQAPKIADRIREFEAFPVENKMVSIEPVIDFDVAEFLEVIKHLAPKKVSIGADSKGSGLPEPSSEKVKELVAGLKNITQVVIKNNLKRFL